MSATVVSNALPASHGNCSRPWSRSSAAYSRNQAMNARIVTSRVLRVSSSFNDAMSTRKAVPASMPLNVR